LEGDRRRLDRSGSDLVGERGVALQPPPTRYADRIGGRHTVQHRHGDGRKKVDEARAREWIAKAIECFGPGTIVTADGLDGLEFSGTYEGHERYRIVFAGSMIMEMATVGSTPEASQRFVESCRRTRDR